MKKTRGVSLCGKYRCCETREDGLHYFGRKKGADIWMTTEEFKSMRAQNLIAGQEYSRKHNKMRSEYNKEMKELNEEFNQC